MIFEIVGASGSLIICASGIPQIVKTYRTRSAGDISVLYLICLLLGMTMLEAYAMHIKDSVFILGNTLSILITCILIMLCFKYRDRNMKQQ